MNRDTLEPQFLVRQHQLDCQEGLESCHRLHRRRRQCLLYHPFVLDRVLDLDFRPTMILFRRRQDLRLLQDLYRRR